MLSIANDFPPLSTLAAPRPAANRGDFSGALDAARELDDAAAERARDAANQLVASAFIAPLLAEVRASASKNSLFHGGRAEEAFGQQLDTILADGIAASANFNLGDAVAGRLTGGKVDARG